MKSALDIDKNKIRNKAYKIPLVISIVLYTGDKKWNVKKYLEEVQEKIIKVIKPEDKNLLKRIMIVVLKEKMGVNKTKELVNSLKGDEENMLAVVDMIRRENQMYIDIGKKENTFDIVKKMLKLKVNKNIIKEATGLKDSEIEKIERDINK